MWRYADLLYETQLLTQTEQPESDNYPVLVEAYSPLSQALTANRIKGPVRPPDAPDNTLQVESLADGLLAGLQTRQDKWD